jgi:hypothetical protein
MSEINKNLSAAEQAQFEALKAKAEGKESTENAGNVASPETHAPSPKAEVEPEVPQASNVVPFRPVPKAESANPSSPENSKAKAILNGILRHEISIDQIDTRKTDPAELTDALNDEEFRKAA